MTSDQAVIHDYKDASDLSTKLNQTNVFQVNNSANSMFVHFLLTNRT